MSQVAIEAQLPPGWELQREPDGSITDQSRIVERATGAWTTAGQWCFARTGFGAYIDVLGDARRFHRERIEKRRVERVAASQARSRWRDAARRLRRWRA